MSRVLFDPEAIRTLAAILSETGLTEIEIADKDSRIRVARTPAPVAAPVSVQPSAGPAAATSAEVGTAASAAGLSPPDEEAAHPGAVLSPMVGIVYLAPEPGSPPFVTAGQTVTSGQTLLLIEAMKTFNQIKAPKSGTVARILVASGTPVEYGEVLIILE
jgi:acetyl-CoA carboxylase biotin carboxyl carrier protein